MNFEKLVKQGTVKPVDASADEVKDLLALAHRDLKLAEFVMTQDWDWAFAIAYNAVLQSSRAFIPPTEDHICKDVDEWSSGRNCRPSWCLGTTAVKPRGSIFSKGYRPAAHEARKNTFIFLKEALGKSRADMVGFFDRMRLKRHHVLYDTTGGVTETEVKELLSKAKEFVALVEEKV